MIATKMNKNNDIISGDNSPDSFAKTVENLDCLAVFVRAIPQWSADNNVKANIIIKGSNEGVEFDLSLSKNGTPLMAEDLLKRIAETEELMKLTHVISEFKRVGVRQEEIDFLIEKAEKLALKLHPKDE